MEEMTIVAAMKELKVLKKRMSKNADLITKYSSQPDSEKPLLGDADKQMAEIKTLIQSSEDLAKRYSDIHANLTYTNLMVKVEVEGKGYTIHELILIRRELHQLRLNSYRAMNDNNFNSTSRGHSFSSSSDNKARIERFYDEKSKQDKIRELEDLFHSIDVRLENVNATTNLVPLP